MVMKFADNIVKVYSTSVAMILTTLVSIPLFGFQVGSSLPRMAPSRGWRKHASRAAAGPPPPQPARRRARVRASGRDAFTPRANPGPTD